MVVVVGVEWWSWSIPAASRMGEGGVGVNVSMATVAVGRVSVSILDTARFFLALLRFFLECLYCAFAVQCSGAETPGRLSQILFIFFCLVWVVRS